MSKQYELLSNAVPESAIWFYKDRQGPHFSTTLPRKCGWTMNTEKCGISLLDCMGQPNEDTYIECLDEHERLKNIANEELDSKLKRLELILMEKSLEELTKPWNLSLWNEELSSTDDKERFIIDKFLRIVKEHKSVKDIFSEVDQSSKFTEELKKKLNIDIDFISESTKKLIEENSIRAGEELKDLEEQRLAPMKKFLDSIDSHIEEKHGDSTGKHKCFLLISDLSTFGQPTGSFGVGTFTSRMMHTEIVVGQSLYEAKNVYYGALSNDDWEKGIDFYPGEKKWDFKDPRFNRRKIYGLIYLGYVETPTDGSGGWAETPEGIIDEVSDTPLPPNQHIKLTTGKKHRFSRWADDTYNDEDGAPKNYCDRKGDEITMRKVFMASYYDIISFNCQSFCKAFMSILRCSDWFIPFVVDRKTNLKLDVTQLSALKKVFGSKDVDGKAIRGEEEEEVTGEGGEGGESTSVESEKGDRRH